MNYYRLLVISFLSLSLYSFGQLSKDELDKSLQKYRENLKVLHTRNVNAYDLPDVKFFLFGMGDRTKYIYNNGELKEAMTGKIIYSFAAKTEIIVPNEYTVYLVTTKGESVTIFENENGVFIKNEKTVTPLSESKLSLPSFNEKKFGPILKVLHQEILININEGKPVPNYFVYHRPWNRDAALMAMLLKQTSNLRLIKNWVLSLNNPFDYNNKNISEADNPGEVLYMLSLFTDKNNPLVKSTIDSAKKFINKDHLEGKTDFGDRYVYQTKWMKFGLKSLGIHDNYIIPKLKSDNYSSLFWWDYKDQHVQETKFNVMDSKDYPYLTWAEDHFYGEKNGFVGNRDYPLSWEKNACCANYAPMKHIDTQYVDLRLGAPHTWHAAEMFLLLINE